MELQLLQPVGLAPMKDRECGAVEVQQSVHGKPHGCIDRVLGSSLEPQEKRVITE